MLASFLSIGQSTLIQARMEPGMYNVLYNLCTSTRLQEYEQSHLQEMQDTTQIDRLIRNKNIRKNKTNATLLPVNKLPEDVQQHVVTFISPLGEQAHPYVEKSITAYILTREKINQKIVNTDKLGTTTILPTEKLLITEPILQYNDLSNEKHDKVIKSIAHELSLNRMHPHAFNKTMADYTEMQAKDKGKKNWNNIYQTYKKLPSYQSSMLEESNKARNSTSPYSKLSNSISSFLNFIHFW